MTVSCVIQRVAHKNTETCHSKFPTLVSVVFILFYFFYFVERIHFYNTITHVQGCKWLLKLWGKQGSDKYLTWRVYRCLKQFVTSSPYQDKKKKLSLQHNTITAILIIFITFHIICSFQQASLPLFPVVNKLFECNPPQPTYKMARPCTHLQEKCKKLSMSRQVTIFM